MALNADDYLRQLQALLPQGPAWSRDEAAPLTDLLAGLAEEFARLDGRATQLLDEADPRTAVELLSDWERITGLDATGSDDARAAAVVDVLLKEGSLSIAYFTHLAAKLGYAIEIAEPEPVPLGRMRIGGELQRIERWWVWIVTVRAADGLGSAMSCTSACNAALGGGVEAAPDLEALFNELKPAHTFVRFVYGV